MAQIEVIGNLATIEKNIPSQIIQLRGILQDKHGIVVPKICDKFLIRCLRIKDGNMDKTVKLVKSFYTIIGDVSKWNATFKPSAYDKDWFATFGLILTSARDSHGRRLVIARANKWKPNVHSFDDVIISAWMLAQYALKESMEDQRVGYVVIWDMAELSLQQVWAVKQKRLLSMAGWLQNGVVGKMKEFHAINHPKIVHIIYAAIKPLLSEKIKKRIQLHSSLESLHNSVDPEILPTFLGGELPVEKCRDNALMKGLLQSDQFFQDMLKNRFPDA